MKAKIKINLDKIVAYTFTSTNVLAIRNITSFERWNDAVCSESDIESITLSCSSSNKQLLIFQIESMIADPILTGNEMLDASLNEDYVIIEFEDDAPVTYTALMNYFKLGLIDIIEIEEEGKTTIILHRLNDERDRINKNLINVGVLFGNFKSPLGIKNIEIDIENYEIEDIYNYVYIPRLRRYYYVVDIQLVNNKFTRLILKEDVLMSWKELIKTQEAFITRYEGSTNKSIVDDRLPLENTLTVSYSEGTPTIAFETKKNITISVDTQDQTNPNILIVTRIKFGLAGYSENAITESIDDGYLPRLAPHNTANIRMYFMPYNELGPFIDACLNDDSASSYLDAIIYLPFNPMTAFRLHALSHDHLYIGDKQLDSTGHQFISASATIETNRLPVLTYQFTSGIATYRTVYQSAYLCIFDGKFQITSNDWHNHEPYTNYELHIPFVGYVNINSYDFLYQRVLIYYTFDVRNGTSTAYVYNKDKHKILWSGTCQIGFKLDFTTTNNLENMKQKQSADLNMILGLIASAVSIGVGVATENPVAIAGGTLSAGKTIAGNVNAKRMIFTKGQTIYGSGDGALYDNLSVYLKISSNKKITINDTVYKHLQGLPYNNYVLSMSSLSGYVEVGEIHFDAKGYDIYSTEIDEIVALLKNGVIL